MKHAFKIFTALLLSTSLSGCALTSAGVKKGDERNFARSLNDVSSGRVIKARMTRAHDFNLKGIDVEVAQGVALLSGNAPTQQDRIEAARIAWSAPKIDQVGNEIKINGKQGFVRNTKDGLLEKSVRTRLTVDKYVKARNFNVETHDGIVYLLGVARTQSELERAARIASTTSGALEVVSYVRVANLPAAQGAPTQQLSQQSAQRDLPNFVTPAPSGLQPSAPITSLPLSSPIPFNAPTSQLGGLTAQASGLGVSGLSGPTAPPQIDIGNRLGKELPSDAELGAFRTGAAGEAISVIESPPYYIDPDTGAEIPVRFDAQGNVIPRLIK
ncbi:MAG: BON domain-containing protein [Litorimonas sp.]